jgi:hypothetical protein
MAPCFYSFRSRRYQDLQLQLGLQVDSDDVSRNMEAHMPILNVFGLLGSSLVDLDGFERRPLPGHGGQLKNLRAFTPETRNLRADDLDPKDPRPSLGASRGPADVETAGSHCKSGVGQSEMACGS